MPYQTDRPSVRILIVCGTCNTQAQKRTLKARYNCKHVLTPHGGSFAFAEANITLVLDDFIPLVMDEDAQGNDVEFVLADRFSCPAMERCSEEDLDPDSDFYSAEELDQLETRYQQQQTAQRLELLSEEDATLAEEGLVLLDDQLEEIEVLVLGVSS